MRLLLWHCNDLEYADIEPSDRPQGIAAVQKQRKAGHFSNVLAAFVCAEEMDTHGEVDEAAVSILSMLKMLGLKTEVVVVPFAHLSSKLAPPQRATELLDDLVSLLKMRGVATNLASFGYHKEFSLHFRGLGHPGSVAFRSFPRA